MSKDFTNLGRVIYLEDGSRVNHSSITCIRSIQECDYSHRDYTKVKPKKHYRYELHTLQGVALTISPKDYEVIKFYALKFKYPLFLVGKDIINPENVIIQRSKYYNINGWIIRFNNETNDYIELSEYEYNLIKQRDLQSNLLLEVAAEYEKSNLLLNLNKAVQ
jgi:hypothetical protein